MMQGLGISMELEPKLPCGRFDFESYIGFGGDDGSGPADREFTTILQLTTYMQKGIRSANSRLMEVKCTDKETIAMQHHVAGALAEVSLVVSHPCLVDQDHPGLELTVPSLIETCGAAVSKLRSVEQAVDSSLRETASRQKTLHCYWLFLCATTVGGLIGLGKMLSQSQTTEAVALFLIIVCYCLFVAMRLFGEEIFFLDKYNTTIEKLGGLTRLKRIITITVLSVEGALVQRCLQMVVGKINTKPLADADAAPTSYQLQILVEN